MTQPSTDDAQTITVVARVEFTDDRGPHAVNDRLVLPYASDAEKAEVMTMISYGIIGTERGRTQ